MADSTSDKGVSVADDVHAIRHRVGEPLTIAKVAPTGPAPRVAALRAEPSKVGVFVIHGMGQQAPFQTLDDVARGLISAAGGTTSDVFARTVRVEEQTLQRLEFSIKDANGQATEVHVYESYWAPLTEGQVSLRDVTQFLLMAGLNGICVSYMNFLRWMFGKSINFGRQVSSTLRLLAALLVVLSLGLMNALIAAVVAARVFTQDTPGAWPSDALLTDLNTILVGYVGISAMFGFGLACALVVRPKISRPSQSGLWRVFNGVLQFIFWIWIAGTILSGFAFLAAMIADQLKWDLLGSLPDFALFPNKKVLWLWLLLLGISYFVRKLLVQYMGDVAAYVSSHTLDRFQELRKKIKKTVYDTAHAVYSAAGQDGGYLYAKIIVTGHSLGSVISYDILNSLLNDDNLTGNPLAAADRTKLFLTFGSPLDKIAFIFARSSATDHQRALAASVQPLIQDYGRFRKMKWINIYASRDIISGKLDFFDDPGASATTVNKVKSEEDRDALIPLIAHTEYWQNPMLFARLYENL
jgi:hypothetical protein